jgi:hypothetical protein
LKDAWKRPEEKENINSKKGMPASHPEMDCPAQTCELSVFVTAMLADQFQGKSLPQNLTLKSQVTISQLSHSNS